MGPWPISDLWISKVTMSLLPTWMKAFSLADEVVAASSFALSGRWNPMNRPPAVAAPAFRKPRRFSWEIVALIPRLPSQLLRQHWRQRLRDYWPRPDTAQPGERRGELPDTFRSGRCCRAWPHRCPRRWDVPSFGAGPPQS